MLKNFFRPPCPTPLLAKIVFTAFLVNSPHRLLSTASRPSPSECLEDLNRLTLSTYQEAAVSALPSQVDHVIVFKDQRLMLWQVSREHDGVQLSDKPLGQNRYKMLKEIVHTVLFVVSITRLIRENQGLTLRITDKIQAALNQLQGVLSQVSDLTELSLEQQCIVSRIASASIRILNQLCSVDRDSIESLLQSYVKQVSPLQAQAMKWASDEQLRLLDQEIRDLAAKHPIVWQRTRALLVVAHGPNESLIEKDHINQIFAAQTQSSPSKMKDRYVYSVECPPPLFGQIDIVKTLLKDLLAKSELDRDIASVVFGDPAHLFKDVLAEPAVETLEDLKTGHDCCPMSKGF